MDKKIIGLGDRTFALDLSDLSVKAFQIEKSAGHDSIRGYSNLELPRGYIDDGRIIEKEKVAGVIMEAVKKAGPKKINTKKVICSLPESKAFLRIVNIPQMSSEEAQEAVRWEIEASIPLSCDQVYFDWQFLDVCDGKQNVLTAAVSKEVVDETMDVLTMAGLDVYGLEIESVATLRSLVPKSIGRDDISLLVDFGAAKTSFIVAEGSIPYFTSSVLFSSEMITDAISKSFNITRNEAEKIKKTQGIEHSFESSSIFNSIKPLLENLSVEIEKTIDFYQSMPQKNASIKRIVMCGGGANLLGLIPYLTTRLCKEVAVGDPWINLNLGNNLPIINKEESVCYATAIGLASAGNTYGNKT
ncbi:MAG TPA: type IV pilus assembly protein PilM [Candidatus Moranbacteria bacterium]|nr:type IV pilus assembly protein PilM [Candidatus Moranbacteria bacterium]